MLKKLLPLLSLICSMFAFASEVSVTAVTAQQRYPWNGLVDIVVTMQGAAEDVAKVECAVEAISNETQDKLPVERLSCAGKDEGSGSVWMRRLIWDARKDVGARRIGAVTLLVGLKVSGVQLWENGPYWAKCNVGASRPEEYGHYFWWGDTVGYYQSEHGWMSVDGTKMYSREDCLTYGKDGDWLLREGFVDEAGDLSEAYDAAGSYFGTPWRIPSQSEFQQLLDNCSWTWMSRNGVYGRLVAGKGAYSENSIFLPAAGAESWYQSGSEGCYWASTLNWPNNLGLGLWFTSKSKIVYGSGFSRSSCFPIRALRSYDGWRDFKPSTVETVFSLDTRDGARIVESEFESLRFNTRWYNGCEQIGIQIGDTEVLRGEDGVYQWQPNKCGEYKVVLKAYDGNGDSLRVEEACFVVNSRVVNGEALIRDGVTTVGDGAFKGRTDILRVNIPSSVLNIEEGAFSGCGSISVICVSSQAIVESVILSEIFLDSSLKKVSFGYGVTKISSRFFAGCNTIESVSFADSVESIGLDNEYLSIGQLARDKSGLWVQDGWVLGYIGQAPTRLELPSGTKGIAAGAFRDQYWLEEVVLPASVIEIGSCAFEGCTELRSISFGTGLKRVGDAAFKDCISLEAVAFPEGLEYLGTKAFATEMDSMRLKSVSLPASLREVGENAFARCSLLTGVTAPTGVLPCSQLFPASYQKLESFVVPAGVTNVVAEMFKGCELLTDIELPESLQTIGDEGFAGCKSLREIGLPDGITRLGVAAFSDCMNLRTVGLPKELLAIEDRTFEKCPMLDSLIVPENVVRIGANIYSGGTYYSLDRNPDGLYYYTGRYETRLGVYGYWYEYRNVNRLTAVYFLGNAPAVETTTYASVPSELKSYVIKGSTGWYREGAPTLPVGGWPTSGNAREITYWQPNVFDVIFDANGGTPATYTAQEITDTTYSLPKVPPTRTGYLFDGWWTERTAGARVTANSRVTANKTHTLYAHWQSRSDVVIVNFNPNGGTVDPMESVYPLDVTFGVLPVPTRIGHAFVGWYTSQVGGTLVTESSSVSKENNELYAHWQPITYTVRFHANGGLGADYDQSFTYNVPASLMSCRFALAGFSFTGWSVTPGGEVNFANGATVENLGELQGQVVDLYAVWNAAGYAVRFDGNGGAGSMANQTLLVGASQALSANAFTRKGYVFAGWATTATGSVVYQDGETVKNLSLQNGTTVVLYAVWTPGSYSVRYSANGGTGRTVKNTVLWDQNYTIIANPYAYERHTFLGWAHSETGSVVYNPGENVVNLAAEIGDEVVLYAVWQEIPEENLPEPGDVMGADKFGDLAYDATDWQVVLCDEPTVGTACLMAAPAEICDEAERETVFTAQVRGAGTVRFFWKTSCDEDPDGAYTWDRAEFRVDGKAVAWCDGITDWEEVVYPIAGEGIHTLAWVYCMDGYPAELEGVEDRVWVGGIAWSGSDYEEELQPLVDPVIDPTDGATFSDESCMVTITCPTTDATIYYSTNGRTPSATDTYRYKGAFPITQTTTVKAVAVRGTEKSAYVTAVITKVDPPPQPVSYAIAYENLCGATHSNPFFYESGSTLVFAAPSEREGYSFEGWTPSAITSEMTGNVVVIANWKEIIPESPYVVQDGVLVGYNGAIPSELIIPNGVTEIAEGLFEGKIDIDVVEIPASLVRIPSGMFSGESKGYPLTTDAYGVKKFRVAEDNPRYRVVNGMLYDYVDKIVVAAEVGISGCVTLPEDCRIVGDSAFQAKHLITDVLMPGSLDRLDYKAFSECSSLTNLDFSATSLSYVGEKCFKDSWNIVGVRFPETLSIIDEKAFASAASQFEGEATALKEVYFSGVLPSVIGSLYPGDADVTTYVSRGNGWDSYVQDGTWQNKPIRYFNDDVGDADPRVISINFSDREAYTMSTLDGFDGSLAGTNILSASWNDYSTAATNGASVARMWDGREVVPLENVQLSYASGGRIWGPHSNGNSPSSQFLNMYLDDMQGASVSVSICNVPFEKYDVIVYYQGDTDSNRFKPVCINGAWYSSVDGETIRVADFAKKPIWGIPNQPQLALGVNAIRINGIVGKDLDVSPGVYEFIDGVKCRSTIAALQIVEAEGEYRVESRIDVTRTSAAEALPDADEYNLQILDGASFEVDCALTRHYNIACDGSVNLVGDDTLKLAALEKLHFAGVTGEVVIHTTTDMSVDNASEKFAYVVDGGVLKLLGVTPARIQVNVGGTFDVNGVPDISYPIALNGGTLANGGAAISEGKMQWWTVTLLADSFIDAQRDFGMIASGYAAFDFHSNGHRLVKRGAGTLFLSRVSFVGGCTLVVEEGAVLDHDGLSSFDNVVIELAGGTVRLGGTSNKLGRFVATQNCSTLYWLSNQSNSICSDDTCDDPFVRVNKGAELRIDGKDFSGWLGDLTEHGWFVNEGTLRFTAGTGTRFFRDHLLLGDGSSVKIDHGSTPLLLYGGAGTEESCQIMVRSGTAVVASGEAGSNARIYLGNSSTGSYGTKGAGVSVGRDATLTVNVSVDGPDVLTKWGDGRLICTKAVTCPVVLAGGTMAVLQETAIPAGRITSGRPDARIVSSFDGGYVVYRLMEDATVGKDVTGLDEPVTVPASWVTEVLVVRYGVETASAFRAQFGENLAEALSRPTGKVDVKGKALTVWDDYVAGTDPTDLTSRLKMIIEIVDGKVRVSWEPNLNEDAVTRVYTLYGRRDLGTGDWEHPIKTTHKFFKVNVSMPNGTETDVSGKGFVPVEP